MGTTSVTLRSAGMSVYGVGVQLRTLTMQGLFKWKFYNYFPCSSIQSYAIVDYYTIPNFCIGQGSTVFVESLVSGSCADNMTAVI